LTPFLIVTTVINGRLTVYVSLGEEVASLSTSCPFRKQIYCQVNMTTKQSQALLV